MLPRVKIFFENGTLGSTAPSDDGVVGLVTTGVVVAGKFALATAYLITKLEGLVALGITSDEADANAHIYKAVKEFYDEAPDGTKLWLMAFADTVTLTDMMDETKAYAKTLIDSAKGAINLLFAVKKDAVGYTATILDGLDADVYGAMTKAQGLAVTITNDKFAPFFVLLPGRHYTGIASNLRNLAEGENNRVAILIGDTVTSSKDACVGLLAGRIAAIPVQRSVARVKSGVIAADNLFIGSKAAENGDPDVIHDSGFITPRTLVGKAGYLWSDDKLATKETDDYALIPRRRVIDKAYRIAYKTIIEELGDEVPTAIDGTMPASIIKSIQNKVETAIENDMTANGNLGNDPGNPSDTGVECFIDHTQNIISTKRLNVRLRVKPHGYNKYIDLYLGFKTA